MRKAIFVMLGVAIGAAIAVPLQAQVGGAGALFSAVRARVKARRNSSRR